MIAPDDWEARELAKGNVFTSSFDSQSSVALYESSTSQASQDSTYATQRQLQPQHQENDIQTPSPQRLQPQKPPPIEIYIDPDEDAEGSIDEGVETSRDIRPQAQCPTKPPPHARFS
ncbi:hypothetical protein BU23DRAFT_598359 [Bimuria novae-zelandiae CBS 107.79]|uniref:Uncharacterized protein n=1 Tax=Bimuria novae-zelandiae CBS 107.79 TaxID=1447943 RepID=A0A6A5USX4_9PLEO|nr:hypothetical protein BU23DRAFT_602678 [Bimuria novae-zelandiae CBS 107.79]KAF1974289.1 hypothetical protein BU23DRAFT_598359 [Bimuria novae-zelandiae CBS 107.79]